MSQDFRTLEFVSHGSAASLDDLAAVSGGFSVWVWGFRAANGANQVLMSKDSALDGWVLQTDNSPSNGVGLFLVQRATTDALAISSTVVSALYTPFFLCAAFNSAASPAIKLFSGDVSTTVTEVSYNTQNSGSGAIVTDVSSNLYVGNLQRATTVFFPGSIQMGGIVSGSFLTAANFETIRGLTRNAINTDTDLSDVQAAFAHVLLFNYQAGDLTDRSGTGNNGTNTNTQSGPNFPSASSPVSYGRIVQSIGTY